MLGYLDVPTLQLNFPLPVICIKGAATCLPHFMYRLEALWTAGFAAIPYNLFS
jgi:hypothetical protein